MSTKVLHGQMALTALALPVSNCQQQQQLHVVAEVVPEEENSEPESESSPNTNNSQQDVEMISGPGGEGESKDQKMEEGSTGVISETLSTPEEEESDSSSSSSPNDESESEVAVSGSVNEDDSTKDDPTITALSKVHHHHHYHYFYHHHFHQRGLNGAQRDLPGGASQNNQSTTGRHHLLPPAPTSSKSGAPELLITGPNGDEGEDEDHDQLSGPQSPITPIPQTPEMLMTSAAGAGSHHHQQNTAALVRTISNGSTFGPINPTWPTNSLFPETAISTSATPPQNQLFPPQQKLSQQHECQPLNLSNNHQKNNNSEKSNNNSHQLKQQATPTTTTANINSTTTKALLLLSSSSSNNFGLSHSSPPISTTTKTTTNQQQQQKSQSSTSTSIFSSNSTSTSSSSSSPVTTTPTTAPTSTVPKINAASAQQQSSVTTTPTILATTIPAAPHSLPASLKLPLSFGDRYLLTSQIEASNLYRCVDRHTMDEYCCKVVLSRDYHDFLSGHIRMDGHPGINQVLRIVVGRQHCFILFSPSYGDLHSYVRTKRRLREPEATALFVQIVRIVADCHRAGIILRDLKLRKFIFSNKERTLLKLETLEGASLCEKATTTGTEVDQQIDGGGRGPHEDIDFDDTLSDKHGCPAYVSPEILYSNSYSGMGADCWSLGVILYTMLVGRYPFHDTNPSVVFCKIRRGTYYIPETLSKHARCLIRSLIRIDPAQRLTAADALAHRWFRSVARSGSHEVGVKRARDSQQSQQSQPQTQPQSQQPQPQPQPQPQSHHHYHHHHHHHHQNNQNHQNSAISTQTAQSTNTPTSESATGIPTAVAIAAAAAAAQHPSFVNDHPDAMPHPQSAAPRYAQFISNIVAQFQMGASPSSLNQDPRQPGGGARESLIPPQSQSSSASASAANCCFQSSMTSCGDQLVPDLSDYEDEDADSDTDDDDNDNDSSSVELRRMRKRRRRADDEDDEDDYLKID